MYEDFYQRLEEGKPLSDRELLTLIILELIKLNSKKK